jgi:hypothetical protein
MRLKIKDRDFVEPDVPEMPKPARGPRKPIWWLDVPINALFLLMLAGIASLAMGMLMRASFELCRWGWHALDVLGKW